MKGEIIRVSGQRESFSGEWDEVYKALGCEFCDHVTLRRDRKIMLVDDVGLLKHLPVNPEATKLYHSVCIPGTTQPIVGDVMIVDMEDEE